MRIKDKKMFVRGILLLLLGVGIAIYPIFLQLL